MHHQTLTIKAAHGLHVRPTALIVKLAKQFNAEVFFEQGGKSVTAKSLFKLQTLDLYHGAEIKILAEGPDEKQAIAALIQLIESIN